MKIYRKIWRFVGLIFPILYYPFSKKNILIFIGTILLVFSLIELIRFYNKKFNTFLFTKIRTILKEKEKNRISATTWFILGAFITISLFDKNIAILTLVISTIGDAFAEYFGEKYGRTKVLNKTTEGSFAFFVSSFTAGLILMKILKINFSIILIGSLIAALVELFSYKIDDNFTVPVITGLLLSSF